MVSSRHASVYAPLATHKVFAETQESVYSAIDENYMSINEAKEKVTSITREEADALLIKNKLTDGHFVIRKSMSHPASFVLCLASRGRTLHYPIELQIGI